MRVISGKCRGTTLFAPTGIETRPTTDRIKETLFNIIAFDLMDCYFLDLFSGSGGIGIESLSRGAKKTVFVEQSKHALNYIHKNLEKTQLKNQAEILGINVINALKLLEERQDKFNIIFMDPPYALEDIKIVLEKAEGVLEDVGYIILERSSAKPLLLPDSLELWKEKIYKTTTLSFMRKKGIS